MRREIQNPQVFHQHVSLSPERCTLDHTGARLLLLHPSWAGARAQTRSPLLIKKPFCQT
jgi:hypothetical protein